MHVVAKGKVHRRDGNVSWSLQPLLQKLSFMVLGQELAVLWGAQNQASLGGQNTGDVKLEPIDKKTEMSAFGNQ